MSNGGLVTFTLTARFVSAGDETVEAFTTATEDGALATWKRNGAEVTTVGLEHLTVIETSPALDILVAGTTAMTRLG